MNEIQKKGSGCGWVALVIGGGMLVVVVLAALMFSWVFKSTSSGTKTVLARFENAPESVELRQDRLADYAAYQAGTTLDRDMFIAWNVDQRRTTLGMETFREKAEGAMVTWQLKVENLTPGTEMITGKFTIPYNLNDPARHMTSSSSIQIRCEFAKGARDSLLTVRRGDWVEIRGKLSLKQEEPVIREARLSGRDAEQER